MGNSKRALDEIRSLAGAGSNAGSDQKKSWLKKIKEFWYQCLCRKVSKVTSGQPEEITLAKAFTQYGEMKESKVFWRCPW